MDEHMDEDDDENIVHIDDDDDENDVGSDVIVHDHTINQNLMKPKVGET